MWRSATVVGAAENALELRLHAPGASVDPQQAIAIDRSVASAALHEGLDGESISSKNDQSDVPVSAKTSADATAGETISASKELWKGGSDDPVVGELVAAFIIKPNVKGSAPVVQEVVRARFDISAGFVLFGGEDHVLCVRALVGKKVGAHGSAWGFPKGHVELGDASLFATAVRELREETGVDLMSVQSQVRLIVDQSSKPGLTDIETAAEPPPCSSVMLATIPWESEPPSPPLKAAYDYSTRPPKGQKRSGLRVFKQTVLFVADILTENSLDEGRNVAAAVTAGHGLPLCVPEEPHIEATWLPIDRARISLREGWIEFLESALRRRGRASS